MGNLRAEGRAIMRRNGGLVTSLGYLAASIVFAVVMFVQPWSDCEGLACSIEPGTLTSHLLAASLIMVLLSIATVIIALVRRSDRRAASGSELSALLSEFRASGRRTHH